MLSNIGETTTIIITFPLAKTKCKQSHVTRFWPQLLHWLLINGGWLFSLMAVILGKVNMYSNRWPHTCLWAAAVELSTCHAQVREEWRLMQEVCQLIPARYIIASHSDCSRQPKTTLRPLGNVPALPADRSPPTISAGQRGTGNLRKVLWCVLQYVGGKSSSSASPIRSHVTLRSHICFCLFSLSLSFSRSLSLPSHLLWLCCSQSN